MRGAMGVGKSSFIKDNKLEQYTLSADSIRLLYQSPVLMDTGKLGINSWNDKKVWKLLFELLEDRMERGEFTIIDATHTTTSSMTQYKDLAKKYRYRVFVLDFTDVPIETALNRNKWRDEYKFVPEQAIYKAYERFKTHEPQGWLKVIKPENFWDEIGYRPEDYSHYNKIHFIGDIHGCNTVLQEYLSNSGGLKDDELYIFLGDYVDRGIENAGTMKFLISIMNNKNVIMLQGNHERWLWYWANDEEDKIRSREFRHRTKKQLEEGNIKKKDVRAFFRKLHQMVYFYYDFKAVLVSHGGLTNVPWEPVLIATEQYVNGVGYYELEVDNIFQDNTTELRRDEDGEDYDASSVFQIHGHRNIQRYPVQVTDRTFNLEGQVELGGNLRVVTLSHDEFETHEIKNTVFDKKFEKKDVVNNEVKSDNKVFLDELRERPDLIKEHEFGHISSFVFRKKVFYDGIWNEQTVKARGLFVNTETYDIVSRSYNKFFNINERNETRIDVLAETLKFPVSICLKENGFLGLVGYDSQYDELVVSSKSMIDGEFAEIFRNAFYEIVNTPEKIREIKDYLRGNNVSLVFECIDPVNDPHIIKYSTAHLRLLDIVKRTPKYEKLEYMEMAEWAIKHDFYPKAMIGRINNWQQFYQWYTEVTDENNQHCIEGYVIEDASGFMTKIKLPFYSFWKSMRHLKDIMSHKEPKVDHSKLYTPLHNQVYNWMKMQDKDFLRNTDIITLRNKFFDETKK